MRGAILVAWLVAAPLAAALRAPAAEIETLLRDEALWSLPAKELPLRHGGFNWTWVEPDTTARSTDPGATFAGRRVSAAIFRFENGRAARLTVFLYSRGDAGTRTEEEFEAQVKAAVAALTAWAGPPAAPPRSLRVAADARAETQSWARAPHQVSLEWGYSRPRNADGRAYFRAEYIRLDLAPAEARGTAAVPPSAPAPAERVRREPGGDVRIVEVPMVDQGATGYCAVAVIERVMRYYGMDYDMHQAAQLAGAGARGTEISNLSEAARKIAGRFRLTYKDLMEIDLLRLVEDYNRRARRAKETPITIGRAPNADTVFRQMKPALLKEVRLDERNDRRRFFQWVRESVDRGAPPIWAVMLGLVPEPQQLPQAAGGHLRLIVGYNADTQEILFSDSWGPGHELKRLSADDAWTITVGLAVIAPKN